ncbi:MAG: HmuY family protein [Crocinitomicaceae bacterium]|nr:HmuY family protein [Crocinitomicaceae bacterium]
MSVIIFFCSCDKGELPISATLPGDATIQQVEMTETYKNQIFFSLESNAVISSNDKTDWDISFSSNTYDPIITLNTSKAMRVHRSSSAFADINSYSDDDWHYDVHSGNLDSTGFGNDLLNFTFIVDRGYNELGSLIGQFKLRVTEITDEKYKIQVGTVDDLTGEIIEIERFADQNFSYYHFGNGQVTISPPTETWDLIFTQYTHLFYDPFTPYLVTGIILNREETLVHQTEDFTFEEIDKSIAEGLTFSSDADVIGYDWKYFDFGTSSFIINPDIIYVIKNLNGFYFKLHFVDFYNDSGLKGYPKFEFQQL